MKTVYEETVYKETVTEKEEMVQDVEMNRRLTVRWMVSRIFKRSR